MDWITAKALCENDGADLLTPRNELENAFFANLAPEKRLFLNINDAEVEGEFVTDGQPITYERFCDEEPNNADLDNNPEHYVAIWRGKNYEGSKSEDCWNDIRGDRVNEDTLPLCVYRIVNE